MTDQDIPTSSVIVGDRLREDYGDLQELADSMSQYGQLQPIVIDDDRNLVAGHRRFRAATEILHWSMIAARSIGDLTDNERQEIELEENIRRKDLTPFERSKLTTALAETAELVISAEPSADFSTESVEKSRGRPPKATSQEQVAKRIGIPQTTLSEAKQHVETAEAYPFMQEPDWSQSAVLDARKSLSKLNDEERETAAAILSEPGVPASKGLPILKNIAKMEPADRSEVVRLYHSNDPRDKSLAKTKAAQLPPDPDPRFIKLGMLAAEIRQCARSVPSDQFTNRIVSLATDAEAVRAELQAAYKEKVNGPSISEA